MNSEYKTNLLPFEEMFIKEALLKSPGLDSVIVDLGKGRATKEDVLLSLANRSGLSLKRLSDHFEDVQKIAEEHLRVHSPENKTSLRKGSVQMRINGGKYLVVFQKKNNQGIDFTSLSVFTPEENAPIITQSFSPKKSIVEISKEILMEIKKRENTFQKIFSEMREIGMN